MFKILKIASLFLFVLCHSFLFAQQTDNPREQSFKVIDFNLSEPMGGAVNSSLTFEFKLQTKKPLQDPYKYPYLLHFSLYKNNQLVWKNDQEKEFYALKKEEFFDGLVFYQIPFEDIKVKNGVQNLLLKIRISYKDYTFPMTFENEIKVTIPELFEYDQQEFNVMNYRVSLDSVRYKTPGILIRFNSKAKFIQNQIKGIKDDPFIGAYVFQIKIEDSTNNKNISFRNSKTGLLSFNVNNLENKHQLFIPFNELVLENGKHTIALQVVATTKEKNKNLSHIQTKEISFTQPKVNAIHFELVKALIKEKKI